MPVDAADPLLDALGLLVGSVPGILVGGWLCTRLPSAPLRVGIAVGLGVSGVRLL